MDVRSGERYEIVVSKRLGARSAAAFDGFETVAIPGDGMILRGRVADQAGLHGVLARLRDFGIPLVSVVRLDPPAAAGDASEQPG